jgi:low affinity Fe/Cu permease
MFDKFASLVAKQVASAGFFIFCILLVVLWAPSGFIIGFGDTWQLIINTTTTILTFLLVALLQNSQSQSEKRVDSRLRELIDKLPKAEDPVE